VSTPEADYPGTTKGLFFVHFLALARRHLPEADVATMCRTVGMPARISRFGSYPIVPYTAFQELLAQRLYPQVELTEGMGLLGREAFLAFAGSVAGRVVTALVVRDVPHIAAIIEKTYRTLNDLGEIRTRHVSRTEFVIEFNRYLQYPQHQHGLLEAGCDYTHWHLHPKLTIRSFERRGPGRVIADFDIRMIDSGTP